MKLKTDDAGHVVVSEGKPVYLHDDGKEVVFDYDATLATISRLNGEAKQHRTAKEAAESKLAAFADIADPAEALKALSTVKNLDAKKLVDAGEVEKIRAETAKAIEEKYAPVLKERDTLKGDLTRERRSNIFAHSKTLAEKLILPPAAAEKLFGEQLKEVDGKMVWHDQNGQPIYSRTNPGTLADLEEGAGLVLDGYPYRDNILKGTGNRGDGKDASNKNGNNGAKTMTRAQFDALDPAIKATRMREGFALTD